MVSLSLPAVWMSCDSCCLRGPEVRMGASDGQQPGKELRVWIQDTVGHEEVQWLTSRNRMDETRERTDSYLQLKDQDPRMSRGTAPWCGFPRYGAQ